MITDDILPFPQHINITEGVYLSFNQTDLDYSNRYVDDKFIVKPRDARAAHIQTVKEYELFKFCNSNY